MPIPFTRTLQGRLALVGVLALVPLLGLFAWSHRQLDRVTAEEWSRTVVQLSEEVAHEYRRVVADAHFTLAILAQAPAIRSSDAEECRRLVRDVLGEFPLHSALGVVDPDGYARCHAPWYGAPLDLGDRDYIRRAFETGEPQVSGFQRGRLTGQPVLSVAHPVLEPDGTVSRVLATGAELDLLGFPRIPGGDRAGMTVTVYDGYGHILARHPRDRAVIGTRVPWDLPETGRRAGPTAEVETFDLDGKPRVFAVHPLFRGEAARESSVAAGSQVAGSEAVDSEAVGSQVAGSEAAGPEAAGSEVAGSQVAGSEVAGPEAVVGSVAVGFDPSEARAGSARLLHSHLVALTLAALTFFLGTWAVLEFAFLRRFRRILHAAVRLGDGDLSARTGIREGEDEVSVLGRTFDRMAENVESLRRQEKELARRTIRERESRLQQLAGSVDEVFWLLDRDARELLYVSPAYEDVCGLPAADLESDPFSWLEVVDPEDRSMVRRELDRSRDAPREFEFRILHPEKGRRWIRYRAFPARDAEGQVFRIAGVARDVTERRELEDALDQSNRLEAVGRLAGGVAHDFNNVLMAIRGYAGLVLDTLDDDDPRRADVQEIDACAERAATLTRQLLAFSRKQSRHPRVIDVNEVVTGVEGMLRRVIGADVELVTSLDPGLWQVRADPNQLEQVLVNLAVNARDAMPRGGRLQIDTLNASLSPLDVRGEREIMEPGEYVRISVSDDGEGMTEEVRRHAFDPFFTTKSDGHGTGLGLAGVYGIVKQSQGFIWVTSEPDQGATFDIYLARAEVDSASVPSGESGEAKAAAVARVGPEKGDAAAVPPAESGLSGSEI